MAGGVRVVQPDLQPGERTPEIDTVPVSVEGEMRERQRIVVAAPLSRVTWGEVLAVAPGVTQVVATLVGEPGLRLLGFAATGTGDARFLLAVDNAPKASGYTNITHQGVQNTLMTGIPVPLGSTATVTVLCRGTQASDFEATIYAEVTNG